MSTKWFKTRLCNVSVIGRMCGYGEGKTKEESIEAAMKLARERATPRLITTSQPIRRASPKPAFANPTPLKMKAKP